MRKADPNDNSNEDIIFSSEHPVISPVIRKHLMMGRVDQIPVIQSQVVRVYISSNYSGMSPHNKVCKDHTTIMVHADCKV